MNLVEAAIKEFGISKVEVIEKLNLSDDEIFKWNTESHILPDEVKLKLLEILGIERKHYLDWYDISYKNDNIAGWLRLIDIINMSADFPSNLIITDPTFFSIFPLIELKMLGCSIPEVPLSTDEFYALEEQNTLPPFYKLLIAYIHECGLMEKWVRIHLIEPFSSSFDLEENEDLLDEFDYIEQSSIYLALRCMDENLLKACGCSESELKKLISKTEKEVSIQFNCISNIISSKGLILEHDLSPYLKYNGSELLHPKFKTWVSVDQEFSRASNIEKFLREQNKLIMQKLVETDSKLDELLSLQQKKLPIPEQL